MKMIIGYFVSGFLLCMGVVSASPPPYQIFAVGPATNGGVGLSALKTLCTTAADSTYHFEDPSAAWPLVAGSPELDIWDLARNVTTPSGTHVAKAVDFKAGVQMQQSLFSLGIGCNSSNIWTGFGPSFTLGDSCFEWTSSVFPNQGLAGSCFTLSWLPLSPNPQLCDSSSLRILCVYVEPTPSPSAAPSFSPSISPSTSRPSTSPITSQPSLNPITSAPTKSPTRTTPSPVEDSDDDDDVAGAEFNIQEYAVPIGVGAGGLAVAFGLAGVYLIVRRKQKRLALRQSLANAGK